MKILGSLNSSKKKKSNTRDVYFNNVRQTYNIILLCSPYRL